MRQKIEKSCTNTSGFLRPQRYYKQARLAFGAVLDELEMNENEKILVPAYIGWSAREGSGVFDPIRERSIKPIFYHMDRDLRIKKEDCLDKIETSGAKVLLVIHYFGFVDPAAKEIIAAARRKGIIVIEDAAHGLFTDRIGGACGRDGDYTLYSLHKMLPMSEGGLLVSNVRTLPKEEGSVHYDIEGYDLKKIADKRVRNYHNIIKLLENKEIEGVKPLYPSLAEGIIPQTLPVVVTGADRDEIYTRMNDLGWGIVSLYHTLIEELRASEYENEVWLSKHITNLPVHQDINTDLIEDMITAFSEVVRACAIK